MKERVLKHVNPARREFLRKLLAGAAFAAPVVASFSVEALTPTPAYGVSNAICIPPQAGPLPAPTVPACPPSICTPATAVPTTPIWPACPTSPIVT